MIMGKIQGKIIRKIQIYEKSYDYLFLVTAEVSGCFLRVFKTLKMWYNEP